LTALIFLLIPAIFSFILKTPYAYFSTGYYNQIFMKKMSQRKGRFSKIFVKKHIKRKERVNKSNE
jgi:hypothetical protein